MFLNDASHLLAFGHDHLTAEDHRADELLAQRRVGVDLFFDQLLEHGRALGVADELEAAALVVLRQVFVECGGDADVRLGRPFGSDPAGRVDGGDRQLRIDGRVHAAHLREARRLAFGDRELFGADFFVGVLGELAAHGRVHVEAVDRRLLRRLGLFDEALAVGELDGRFLAVQAWVAGEARLAQPGRFSRRRRRGRAAHGKRGDAQCCKRKRAPCGLRSRGSSDRMIHQSLLARATRPRRQTPLIRKRL